MVSSYRSDDPGIPQDVARSASPAPSTTSVHQAGSSLNYQARMTHPPLLFSSSPGGSPQLHLGATEILSDPQGIKKKKCPPTLTLKSLNKQTFPVLCAFGAFGAIVGMSYFTGALARLGYPLLKASACGTFSTSVLSLQLLSPAPSRHGVSPLPSLSMLSCIEALSFPLKEY